MSTRRREKVKAQARQEEVVNFIDRPKALVRDIAEQHRGWRANGFSRLDMAFAAIGVVTMLLACICVGGLVMYSFMRGTNPTRVEIINQTIYVDRNITITETLPTTITLPTSLPTTTTTIESYRIDSNGMIVQEDIEKLYKKVKEQLEAEMAATSTTTSSTTSTTHITRLSTAPMYRLYNPIESANFDGTFFVNKSIDVRLCDKYTGKCSVGTSWQLFPLTPAEARYFSENLDEENAEGVYYKLKNGTLLIVGDMSWKYAGGQ